MSCNPDRTKQAQEIIFSSKKNATTHPPLFFNNFEIKLNLNQKHLGLTLDSKLSFNEHINDKIHQASKGVAHLWKLQTILLHNSLPTIYKSFIRSLLNYGDMINDQPSNALFSKKLNQVPYNVPLAITGANKGSSLWKIVQGIRTGISSSKKMGEEIVLTLKRFFNWSANLYLWFTTIPIRSSRRHVNSFNTVSWKSKYFKNYFIPNVIGSWYWQFHFVHITYFVIHY